MEIADVRKRIHSTIEHAKQRAAERRSRGDEAARAYSTFLDTVAVPMFRQVANVLKSEGDAFSEFTPLGSVRLMADRTAESFVELTLDATGDTLRVVVHPSRIRGRRVIESERAVGSPAALAEEGV